MQTPSFQGQTGWRSRPLFGALGLRPPLAQHSRGEGKLLRQCADGASTVVEIGVAEGGSAWELAQVLSASANLHLIDPYHRRVAQNIVPARIIAKRLVQSVARCNVTWHESFSSDVVKSWEPPIDFLFIDGDHSYEGVRRDWAEWTPHVAPSGYVALHDAHWDGVGVDPEHGPAKLLLELRSDPRWDIAEAVDSLAILRPVTPYEATTPASAADYSLLP
jgi:predicted O-methyltransferase YrrM